MCGGVAPDHYGQLVRRIVLQDALSEVTKIDPPLKLRVFLDDFTALLMVKTRKFLKWQGRQRRN